ncbi:MAG: 7-carboxy-7-deazaguanine synthase QueE [Candidatus Omnitrophica bacterium]|nr:7-carboxy-7-deazaguanine synthase QueE [Candidatus Omnitrophota bacterium]
MLKAQISEVFFSLQGEGPYVGTGHVFVRFAGCNINCCYCDTPKQEYKEYDIKPLICEVNDLLKKHNAGYLSLTGGEPLLQTKFIIEFLKKACFKKTFVYLETNGILSDNFHKVKGLINIVSMDIKLPSATQTKAYWSEHSKFLKLCTGKKVFVKTIITASTVIEDIKKMVSLLKKTDQMIPLIMQPESKGLGKKLLNKTMKFQEYARGYLNDVRIIPQMHKLLNIR